MSNFLQQNTTMHVFIHPMLYLVLIKAFLMWNRTAITKHAKHMGESSQKRCMEQMAITMGIINTAYAGITSSSSSKAEAHTWMCMNNSQRKHAQLRLQC